MKTVMKASGIAYLLIFIAGFYANFAILETLVDFQQLEEATLNITKNSFQYRKGLLGFLVMLISDVFLIWSLYKVTRPIHKTLSYIASLLRGIHALFFTIALVYLSKVNQITSGAVDSAEIRMAVINSLIKFDQLWTVGLLFFGAHLFLLGDLLLKSDNGSKGIGGLLILAAFGYCIDGFSKLFLTSYNDYQLYFEIIVVSTAVLGELSFTIWLFVKGFSRNVSTV